MTRIRDPRTWEAKSFSTRNSTYYTSLTTNKRSSYIRSNILDQQIQELLVRKTRLFQVQQIQQLLSCTLHVRRNPRAWFINTSSSTVCNIFLIHSRNPFPHWATLLSLRLIDATDLAGVRDSTHRIPCAMSLKMGSNKSPSSCTLWFASRSCKDPVRNKECLERLPQRSFHSLSPKNTVFMAFHICRHSCFAMP